MANDISKLCSDFLRETYSGLKASHAREVVAWFFGYRTHAALLSDTQHCVNKVGDAEILIPDIALMEERRESVTGLSEDLSDSRYLAEEIADYLQEQQLFAGEVWILETDLMMYMLEEYLPNNVDPELDNYLADVIAGTNAYFDESEYDVPKVEIGVESLNVTVNGRYHGETLDDHLFAGDTINMVVEIALPRVAGRTAFAKPEEDVHGEVMDYSEEEDEEEPAAVQ